MSFAERGRSTTVFALLIGGAIGITSSTQTWLTVTRSDVGDAIPVPGAEALPLLAPLSLAVLALGAAMSIVGPVMRYIFAVLALAGGALLAWSTAEVAFARPLSAVASTVTEVTGLGGIGAVSDTVAGVSASFWPYLALAGWVLVLAGAVFALVTAHAWKRGGRRFRTDVEHGTADGPVDAVDSWDDLSRGTDPTR